MWPNIEYKLVLLKAGNPYTQVKQLGIDIAKNEKTWRKRTYYYSANDISYRRGRKNFVFKDVDSGNTIFRWGKADAPTDPSEPGAKMFQGLIAQAISAIGGNYGLAMLIIVGIAGIVGGLLLGISPLGDYFTGGAKEAAKMAAFLGVML